MYLDSTRGVERGVRCTGHLRQTRADVCAGRGPTQVGKVNINNFGEAPTSVSRTGLHLLSAATPSTPGTAPFSCRDNEDEDDDDDDNHSPSPSAAAAMRVTEVIIDVRPRCPTPMRHATGYATDKCNNRASSRMPCEPSSQDGKTTEIPRCQMHALTTTAQGREL